MKFLLHFLSVSALVLGLGTSCKKPFIPDANYEMRKQLFAEIQPVLLKNCTLKRFGAGNDEGYLMCDNLLEKVQSAYSYGIEGRDAWGCEVSERLNIPIYQYDCFDLHVPVCKTGKTKFYGECIGDKKVTIDKRLFNTLDNQIAQNGDAKKNLLLKMDVEGAEWDSLASASDDRLNKFDQIAIEFHKVNDPKFLNVIRKLKQNFYFVHIHFNNNACSSEFPPFPAAAFQALLVNKKLGEPDTSGQKPKLPHPLDVPDLVGFKDCQTALTP
jgi:hypothetical protein